MLLNDRQIKNAKPQAKPYKLADGHSLYMLVAPNGGKYWRFDYAIDGKRKTLAIGTYPTITLLEARRMVASGRSPSEAKQEAKAAKAAALTNTLGVFKNLYHSLKPPDTGDDT